MQTKLLELRDEGTFIALLAVDMNPGSPYRDGIGSENELRQQLEEYLRRTYLLRRCGYPCDGRPNIVITKLSADGDPAQNDPHWWGNRTFSVGHDYIIKHWDELRDGSVVDVQFILGETAAPKRSERETAPL